MASTSVWALPFPSDVVYVNPGGSDSLTGQTALNAKKTLAGAISAIPSGGCISVNGQITPGSSSTLTLPISTRLTGSSRNVDRITWASDIGTNSPGLITLGGQSDQSVVEHLTFIGPGGTNSPTIGIAPAHMWGVQANGGFVDDCYFYGFYANLVLNADHHVVTRTTSTGGWYNLYFPPNPPSMGNQKLFDVLLYSAARASVGIGDKNAMSSVTATGVECGQAPVGYFFEPRSGQGSAIVYSNFTNCGFEAMGNMCIYDSTPGGANDYLLADTLWSLTGGGPSYSSTFKDTSLPSAYSVLSSTNNLYMYPKALGQFNTPPGGIGAFGSPNTFPTGATFMA